MSKQDSAYDCYLKAKDLLFENNAGEAIEQFRKAIKLDPTFTEAYHELASELERQEKYDDAVELYKQWATADPYVDYVAWSRVVSKTSDPEKNLYDLQAAVGSLVDQSHAHNLIGIALLNMGRYEDAIREYKEAIAITPDYKWSYYNWGLALGNLGRFEEAIEKYRRTVEIDENYQAAYEDWGKSIAELNDPEPHLSVYSHAIRKQKSAPLLLFLAKAFHSLEKYSDAAAAYKEAINLDASLKNDADLFNTLGNCHFALKEYHEALAAYAAAIEADPNLIYPRYNRGLAFERLKEYDTAGSIYIQTIRQEAYEPAYSSLSNIIARLTNPYEVLAELSEIIKTSDDTAMMHHYLGNAYLNLKHYDRAIAEFEIAATRNDKWAMPLVYWGIALEKKRKFQEALARYKQAIQIDPNYEFAYTQWIRILDKIDSPEKEFDQVQLTIKKQFNNASTWLNELGLAFTSLQLYDRAETVLRLSMKNDPKNGDANYYLGNLLLDQMRYDEAMQQFETAYTKNKDFTYAYHNYAFSIARLGENRKAKKHWKEALENYRRRESIAIASNDSYHFLYCGSIYLNVFRDFDNAEEQFKKGLAINGDDPEILTGLAQLYFDRKSEEIGIDSDSRKRRTVFHVKAMDYIRMCETVLRRRLEIDKDPEDYYLLARLYALVADEKKSKEYYKKYLDHNDPPETKEPAKGKDVSKDVAVTA